jgi:hypothetical protein
VTEQKSFYGERNEVTRIDVFEEVDPLAEAALRSFFRRLGAPHLVDEVILPLLGEGDSQIVAAVRDRPWPPWGLGARHVSAVCQTHLVGDETFGLSPVYVTDEDLANVGMVAAVYKEAVEYLAVSPRAEVNYLLAEGSRHADHVLRKAGFERTEDVFVTEAMRYFTYRIEAEKLRETLGLARIDSADLLAEDVDPEILTTNALFHHTIYAASRPEWAITVAQARAAELAQLVRGGHYSKPGGVPSGTGRFGGYPVEDPGWEVFATVRNFLAPQEHSDLFEFLIARQDAFRPSTIKGPGDKEPSVDERTRRSLTLDKLDGFRDLFVERIKEYIAEALDRIGEPGFPIGGIEIQATASGDGDLFRTHLDEEPDGSRAISFVYFLHREPRRFSGGELRVYETRMIDGKPVPVDHGHTLVPRLNTIVFFPSRHQHEVLPVRVPSKEFADSRFTINGWIHRG